MNEADLQLAQALWIAYRKATCAKLLSLSKANAQCFPKLQEICEALVDYISNPPFARPQRKLKSILAAGVTDFNTIFNEFGKTKSIYGFGDLQVKSLLEQVGWR